MTITVVNKHHKQAGEYIGRGSPLGNPFPIDVAKGQTRQLVISNYKEWLERQIAHRVPRVIDELNRLGNIALKGDLALQCFCSPQPCHGDIIKNVLDLSIATHKGE